MPLDQAIDEFLMSQIGTLSDDTISYYRYGLNRLLAHVGGNIIVEDVTRSHIRRFRHSLATDTSMAPATRNMHLRAVRRFFGWLVAEWEIESSPAKGVKLFDESSDEVRAIEMSDYHAMTCAARASGHQRDVAIMAFLLATGCRVGGLIALTLDNLDLPALRAYVIEKGNNGRWLFFPQSVAEEIRRYDRPRDTPYREVFLSLQRHKPMAANGIYQMLQKHARAAGVVDGPFNPHAFRHRFAIEYLRNGGDLSSLSAIMGHSDISITHEYYARWSTSALQEQHARYNPLASNNGGL